MNDYQQELRDRWNRAPLAGMPNPWRAVTLPHVGGVFAIGLSPDGDFLLILSVAGRGVIRCYDGAKVARDYNEDEGAWLDRPRLQAEGIGPLAGQQIRVAGSFIGGGLARMTDDGWSMHAAAPQWPNAVVWCEKPDEKGFYEDGLFWKLWDWDEPFAYGFSENGKTAVIACSNSIEIWVR